MTSFTKAAWLLALTMVAVGCTSENETSEAASVSEAVAEKPLVIYSYRHPEALAPLLDAFTQETGIKTEVKAYRGDGLVDLYQQSPEKAEADLLILVDALRMQAIADTGYLRALPTTALQAIPEGFKSHEGQWLGLGWRARGPVRPMNTELQPGYQTLAEQGSICVRAGQHVYNRGFLAWLLEAEGEEAARQWVKQVHQQRPEVQGGDRIQMAAIAEGHCQLAFMNHYYLARMQADANPEVSEAVKNLVFGWPNTDLEMQSNVSGIAVTRQGANPAAADQLANWLVQPENLETFAATFFEFPVTWPNHNGQASEHLKDFMHLKPAAPLPADYVHQAAKASELLSQP